MALAAACESTSTAPTRTSTIRSSSATSLRVNGVRIPKPALLTSRSTGRSASASRSATRCTWSRSDRSAASTSTSTPYRSRSSVGALLQPARRRAPPARGRARRRRAVGRRTTRSRPWPRSPALSSWPPLCRGRATGPGRVRRGGAGTFGRADGHLQRQLDPLARRPRRRLAGAQRSRRGRAAGDQVPRRPVPHRAVRRARVRGRPPRAEPVERRRGAEPGRARPTSRSGFPGMPTWGEPEPAAEARAIGATCDGVRVWSVYVPNGRQIGDPHMEYKLAWLHALAAAGRGWLADDPQAQVVFMGDWNVAPTDDDVWSPEFYADKSHTSPAGAGRLRAPWSTPGTPTSSGRSTPAPASTPTGTTSGCGSPRREGMRIDFVLASPALAARVTDAASTARSARARARPTTRRSWSSWREAGDGDPTDGPHRRRRAAHPGAGRRRPARGRGRRSCSPTAGP